MISPNEQEHSLDVSSSSQLELGRLPAGDAKGVSPDDTVILELHGGRSRSDARELLRNQFPADA